MVYTSIIVNNALFKVPAWFANAIKRLLCSMFTEFNHSTAFLQFKNWLTIDKKNEKLLTDNITSLNSSLSNQIIEAIDDVRLYEKVYDVKSKLFKQFLSHSKSRIELPKFLSKLSNLEIDGIGKGEACVPFLFSGVNWLQAGSRYDFKINGEYWHFKDHRNCSSTPMGRPKGCETFFATPIMKFISSLGVNVSYFGTDDFKNNIKIENAICSRYKTDDIHYAAEKFEEELNVEFHSSAYFGEALGVIYMISDNGVQYIERVDVRHICLYANSARGIAAGSSPGRFTKAIVYRKTKEEQELKIKKEKENKANERKMFIEANKKQKHILKLREQDAKKRKADAERRAIAWEFARELQKHKTTIAVAKSLSISSTTAQSRKKLAKKLGFLEKK